ncbi:MAG: helix-turn-helix domain-containing protein, partial [bacterium]
TILLLDKGYSCSDIKEILLLDEDTIRANEKKYLKEGLDELLNADRKKQEEFLKKYEEIRENIVKFFNSFDAYGGELESLLTEKFQLVGT